VHLTNTGKAEFTLFIRAQLDALRAQGIITSGVATILPLGTPMAQGNRGDNVKALQTALNTYLNLPKKKRIAVDGMYGKGTVRAVQTVETNNALEVDGAADDAVLALLGINGTTLVLKQGAKHASVKTAQTALGRVMNVKLRADGDFGPATTRLVKRFQKSIGFKQTGAINYQTWIALLSASAQR
jgi:peptidoglycan hydrolase-like protein with peptidoglycan-binding domain